MRHFDIGNNRKITYNNRSDLSLTLWIYSTDIKIYIIHISIIEPMFKRSIQAYMLQKASKSKYYKYDIYIIRRNNFYIINFN